MPRRRPRTYVGRMVVARPRLVIGFGVAILASFLAPPLAPTILAPATRMLIGWNVGLLVYVGALVRVMILATPQSIRRRAEATDEGRVTILVLVTLAAGAAIGAIIVELGLAKDLHGLAKGLHFGLAGLTILSAWAFIHFTFALHYAHEYFDPSPCEPGEKQQVKGGVTFPGTDEPDYWDFLYFSFIIGVAAQTADVAITSKTMRRTSLAHSLLAFLFNSAILALTINIAAGLI